MTTFHRLMIALLTGATLFAGAANAASTTNYSDQWWVPSESGWGASVLQQWDTVFIDIFVYGPDNKPTWFTGAAYHQSNSPSGHAVFIGDLYATTGPYYGGAFNPAAVTPIKVGTLTFDSDTVNTATLSYTVNGVPIAKNVTRQTWRFGNISGNYVGSVSFENTGCMNPADNGHTEWFGTMLVVHNQNNTVVITGTGPAGGMVVTGIYSQYGHMGGLQGLVALLPGEGVAFNAYEIEINPNGMTYRFAAQGLLSGCYATGRVGMARR